MLAKSAASRTRFYKTKKPERMLGLFLARV